MNSATRFAHKKALAPGYKEPAHFKGCVLYQNSGAGANALVHCRGGDSGFAVPVPAGLAGRRGQVAPGSHGGQPGRVVVRLLTL